MERSREKVWGWSSRRGSVARTRLCGTVDRRRGAYVSCSENKIRRAVFLSKCRDGGWEWAAKGRRGSMRLDGQALPSLDLSDNQSMGCLTRAAPL